jgi:hypothetical protein
MNLRTFFSGRLFRGVIAVRQVAIQELVLKYMRFVLSGIILSSFFYFIIPFFGV